MGHIIHSTLVTFPTAVLSRWALSLKTHLKQQAPPVIEGTGSHLFTKPTVAPEHSATQKLVPHFHSKPFLLFLLQGHSFSMFVKEDLLILHYLFLSCLFVAIAVLSFLLTHWPALVVGLVPIRWLVCLNKTYFYRTLNVSTFM